MKLIYEKLTLGSEEGFTFKEIRSRSFSCPWHFHAEYELILTLHCPGYRMVGDNVTPLEPGDLVLVGSNLPHIWQSDERTVPQRATTHILLAQFEENFLGRDFWQIPATHPLRQLLKRADVGLHFTGQTRDRVARLMGDLRGASGLERMALFLSALAALAADSESHALASPGYTAELNPFNQQRMARVFCFISERLHEPICVQEAGRLVGLSVGAFSRFFHRHTGRTFPDFVNQLRVGRACRSLAENDAKIIDIAYACGFTNLSNFNRQFLRLKKITPREFRQRVSGIEAGRSG